VNRQMVQMRLAEATLHSGDLTWVKNGNPDGVVSFIRKKTGSPVNWARSTAWWRSAQRGNCSAGLKGFATARARTTATLSPLEVPWRTIPSNE
jgi:hypothetical protein